MSKKESGKGGNFDTRANPFRNLVSNAQTGADFGSHSNLGIVIDKVVGAGCGLILSRTRDAGAICITVLDGDTRHRTYCSSNTELEAALGHLDEYYTQP